MSDKINSWSTIFEGSNNIISYSFTKDKDDNIYVSGTSETNKIIINNIEYKANTDSSCGFITKLDKNGKVQWFQFIAGILPQAVYSISLDSNNNSYITGVSSKNIIIDTTEYRNEDVTLSGFLIKFNNNGVVVWVKWINGPNVDYSYSITIDSLNNIYVAGATISSNINNNIPTRGLKTTTSTSNTSTSNTSTSNASTSNASTSNASTSNASTSNTSTSNPLPNLDCSGYIIKFNSDGESLWFKWIDGLKYDIAYSVAVDSNNNLYVTGSSKSTSIKIDDNEYSRINENEIESIYLLKITNTGTVDWCEWIAGNNVDIVSKIVIDSNDYIYLTGYSFSDFIIIDNKNYQRNNKFTGASFIIKFNNNVVEWFNWVEGDKDIYSYCMAIDKVGNLYFCGTTNSKHILTNKYKYENKTNNNNSFLIKYNQRGIIEWNTWLYNDVNNDSTDIIITDLIIDNNFNIFFNIYTNVNHLIFNNKKLSISKSKTLELNTVILKYNIQDFNFNNSSLFLFIITNKYKIYKYLFNIMIFIIFVYSMWLIYINSKPELNNVQFS